MAITGTPTKHASEDRLDRITLIAMTIGFGKVIKERMIDGKWYQVTDSGVLIVRDRTRELVITMWAACHQNVKKVYADDPIPKSLEKTMKNNQKRFPENYTQKA